MGGDQVACFDGARLFFLTEYGLPPGASYSISEDSSGAIWIGAESGVYRFSQGRIQSIAPGVAISVVPIHPDLAIAAVGPPGRGIPDNTSLLRIKKSGSAWKSEIVMNLHSPGPLTVDHAGVLLYPLPAQGWGEIPLAAVGGWRPGAQLPVRHNSVPAPWMPGAGAMRVSRDRFGCVWIGSEGQNIYNCGGDRWPLAPFAGASMRPDLTESSDGAMLLNGFNLLAVGRPGSFRLVKTSNGLPQLFSAIEARDGTIWLGGAQGLYRFASPFRMESWTARDGVANPWCLQRLGDRIFAGLDRAVGLLTSDRQRWQSVTSLQQLGQVVNLMPVGNNSLLAALNPGGAVLIGSDGRILASTAHSASGVYGLRLAKRPNQEIWLAGLGLGRLTRAGSHLNFENHYLQTQPAGNVLDIQYEEHTRKLWACYNGGLTVGSDDGHWREITTRDGLLLNPCWSLAALPNGDVWYGYYNTPAFAVIHPVADGRFTVRQFRAADEIPDPESINFDVDQRGWLWRGGNAGLSVADPAEAAAGKWLHFDQSDGLSGEGVNSGSYFADTDGSLWMGIDISIFHYTPPPDLVTPAFAPQVFLSAFSWNGGPPKFSEAVAGLPHGSRIVAHIGSLQFDRRSALRLRYRLLPDQSSWRESKSLNLPLGLLSSGSHTLEVQARVFTGPWSPILSRSFSVLLPVWLTTPFLVSYFSLMTLLVFGAYLVRRKHLADQAQLLPDLAQWRLGALLPDVHQLSGTVLDERFDVGQLLARGGFANVMDGYDRVQQQRCAVKIFRNEVKDKAWVRRGFEQEVAALQRLRHPHVVSIYAHGNTPAGAPYLIMEFVEGRNLREILEAGALPPGRIARLLSQLAGALEAIHAQHICHRDVKPENIIVRHAGVPEEEAVLIDFSIAMVKDADETMYGLSRAAGSFDYMAPEQAVGYAQPSSDIYSLAKLVIEMLTGRQLKYLLPDAALDLPDRVRDLARSLDPHLSEESISMLAAALEFDPTRRPSAPTLFAAPLVKDLAS